jgi:hypothetical protein
VEDEVDEEDEGLDYFHVSTPDESVTPAAPPKPKRSRFKPIGARYCKCVMKKILLPTAFN